jgi:hypothetical protein
MKRPFGNKGVGRKMTLTRLQMVHSLTQYADLYQGILYFKDIIGYQATHVNVILFTSIRKVRIPYVDFHGTKESPTTFYPNLLYRTSPKS